MSPDLNHLNQPVGAWVPNWAGAAHPGREPMEGAYCRVEPLRPEKHARQLFESYQSDSDGRNWTYLPYGPFAGFEEYRDWLGERASESDPLFYAIIDKASGRATGVASYLRINPADGSIEVGHLNFSPLLQGTRAATDAMYLMMERAFGLGYRRYEWKCNALNDASRNAALRLGFSFEGVFRQARVIKGRNRDTAWFSVIDQDWPELRGNFRNWLDPQNFDEQGRQRASLSKLTAGPPNS